MKEWRGEGRGGAAERVEQESDKTKEQGGERRTKATE